MIALEHDAFKLGLHRPAPPQRGSPWHPFSTLSWVPKGDYVVGERAGAG
jgi:hypothetical protein